MLASSSQAILQGNHRNSCIFICFLKAFLGTMWLCYMRSVTEQVGFLSSYLQTSRGHLRTPKSHSTYLFLMSDMFFFSHLYFKLYFRLLGLLSGFYNTIGHSIKAGATDTLQSTAWHQHIIYRVLSNACRYYSKQYPLKENKFLLLKRLESLALVKIWHTRLTGQSPSQGTNLLESEPPWPY